MKTNRATRRAAALFAAAALVGLGACGGSDEAANATAPKESAGASAELKDFDFQPEPVEVAVGESVTWTNQDDILHTVTSGVGQEQGVPGVSKDKDAKPDGLFDQEMDGVGAEFSFTFEKAGEYAYYCAIHPGMTGTVIVE